MKETIGTGVLNICLLLYFPDVDPFLLCHDLVMCRNAQRGNSTSLYRDWVLKWAGQTEKQRV
uniref:Uncharacterized protein n=1 Tax=Anguilla anguilla TaxID=7936 RepID=A0A0E9XMT5_ANGAN